MRRRAWIAPVWAACLVVAAVFLSWGQTTKIGPDQIKGGGQTTTYVAGGSGALSIVCNADHSVCEIDVTDAVPLKRGANTWEALNDFSQGKVILPPTQ